MTPLLGRPVIEHIIGLLKRHGIVDICLTLCYQPQSVMEYFGDGERFGVRLTYFVEKEALGTAGGAKNCMACLGGGDFLVIGGDCVCDLDLSRAIRAHRERSAAATLVLYHHDSPLEYGLVVTDRTGRVERFVEKPRWGEVFTDQINTGIYILSPAVMDRVPEGRSWDFGRDLFPALLRDGVPVYGCPLEGYWCDMGDCRAYLDCTCHALDGRAVLDMGMPRRGRGIWSAQPVPEGVELIAPCWIGEGAVLEKGAQVGPYAVLDRAAKVRGHARVQRSILLEGAEAGPRSTVSGAVLCPGALVQRGAALRDGAVLGENALVESDAVVLEEVRIWPGQRVPAGCRLAHSITGGSQMRALRFGDSGAIRGVLGEDLGPEALLSLGGILAAEGRVAIGCSDTAGARMLARAAMAGAAAAGGDVLLHGLTCPVQGAYLAAEDRSPASLFVEEADGTVYLHIFDSRGLPLDGRRMRKLEQTLLRGEVPRVHSAQVGQVRRADISQARWAGQVAERASLRRPALRRVTAAVGRDTPEDRALAQVLTAMGCRLEEEWRPGIPAFRAGRGGFLLTAQDERGALVDSGQLLGLVALIEMENGSGEVAVPAGASAAVDLVAAGYGGTVLRLDRNGERARALYAAQPWVREAPSAAARICARMGISGQKLEELIAKTPRFSAWRREVPLTSGRGQVMQALAREYPRQPQGEGLRVHVGSGWVYLVPAARRSALRVLAEGPDLELAAELCDLYADRTAELDRDISRRSAQGGDKKQ